MKNGILLGIVGSMWMCGVASAAPHDIRVPLHDGKLQWADLAAAACKGVHLPPCHPGNGAISLRGWRGSLFLAALNASCGDACHITVAPDSLDFRFDTEKIALSVDHTKQAVRTFVATDYPEATASQARRFGLFLPARIDPAKPLVVLLHGLDCNIGILQPMGDMLESRGVQVAYFSYPSDQAISADIQLLDQRLGELQQTYPGIHINLVGHSMGGLIARGYVEGNTYRNEVDHLIMVGTPNNGSAWARYHLLLKAQKEFYVSRSDPDWRWTWMITDGLGEGARDLSPHSEFLKQLNSRPRRQGVAYTVIAGSHSALATFESEIALDLADCAPAPSRKWWTVRQLETAFSRAATHLAGSTNCTDGPVSVRSARLPGVRDVVVVPADHCGLFVGNEASPPAALPVILDRLGVSAPAQ